ncbi:hypothetical protein ACLB2K_016394 [Fragaria x ananassa]
MVIHPLSIGGSKAGAPGFPSDAVHSLIDKLGKLEDNSCIWVIPPSEITPEQLALEGGSSSGNPHVARHGHHLPRNPKERESKFDFLSLLRLGVPQQGSSPSQPSCTLSSNESSVATPTSDKGPRAGEQRPEELIWTPSFLQPKRERALGLATPISAPSPPRTCLRFWHPFPARDLGTKQVETIAFVFSSHLIFLSRGHPPMSRCCSPETVADSAGPDIYSRISQVPPSLRGLTLSRTP